MPITLGSPTTPPPWNRYIVAVLWLCQFFSMAFIEFWFFIIVTFFGGFGKSTKIL
jgi:hypothetical protein